ncbi:MAG: BatD family protein [Tannerellaceae bacterium]|jgi:hypothetical protein|nr:BatD family protein [Tannerellaceae bacterium]
MVKHAFLFIFFYIATAAMAAPNIVFKASAPETVVAGQQFQLTYTVNAQAEGNSFRLLEEINGIDVLFGPATSFNQSVSNVNGQMVSETSVRFTFTLVAQSEGSFALPAATVRVNNANYTSNALTVKVLPPDKASSAQDNAAAGSSRVGEVFMVMNISKRSVYEQEGFLVTFKLYAKEPQIRGFNNMKFPEFDGFLQQEIELPQEKQLTQENYNGSNYFSVVIKQTVLYPQRSGNITIDAGKFEVIMRIRMQQRVRSIFDMFEDTYQDVTKSLTTAPAVIEVKPLPTGKPASYAGAVGEFTMKGELAPANVKANEAITLKIDIAGTGNLRVIKNPEVNFPNDFEVYDPKVESNMKTTTAGVSGSKHIEYVAIPRFAGDFEIQPILFSYFDTRTGTYKTLSAGPFAIHVEKGEGGETGAPVVNNYTNRQNVKNIGEDIRYLKLKNVTFIDQDELFFGSAAFYLCYLIPALCFAGFFIIYRKQARENANIALVRTRKANKTAAKRLKNAARLMKDNRKEDFYVEMLRAVWGYISDKLNIPVANLTKDNVEAELNRYGVDEGLIHDFMSILNTCEFARYAPAEMSDGMKQIYCEAVNAIEDMENSINK